MQQPIVDLVTQALITKKKNNTADTTELEQQIDKLVYKLYGLTNTEIAIIEKN
jgi:uncharacterized protein with PhoU and TrkA domain